jgi:hypothetical protein
VFILRSVVRSLLFRSRLDVPIQTIQSEISVFHAGQFQLSSFIVDGQQTLQMRSVDKMDYTKYVYSVLGNE